MKLIALTDLHGDVSNIEALFEAVGSVDVILLTGDITHFGDGRDASRIIDAIKPFGRRLFAVAGNCDYADVDRVLLDAGISLHGRHETVDGVTFLGAGKSLPCLGATPNEVSSDAEFAERLEAAYEGTPEDGETVLITHQPPIHTLNDQIPSGGHVGSRAIRSFIEAHPPLIAFCGHIHEGRGIDRIGQTAIVNPGPLASGGYAYGEIDGGLQVLEIREV